MNKAEFELLQADSDVERWEAWLKWYDGENRRVMFIGDRPTFEEVRDLVAQFTVGVTGAVQKLALHANFRPPTGESLHARYYVTPGQYNGIAGGEMSHYLAWKAWQQLSNEVEESMTWKGTTTGRIDCSKPTEAAAPRSEDDLIEAEILQDRERDSYPIPGDRYERLEREHMGDPLKGTGIYADAREVEGFLVKSRQIGKDDATSSYWNSDLYAGFGPKPEPISQETPLGIPHNCPKLAGSMCLEPGDRCPGCGWVYGTE